MNTTKINELAAKAMGWKLVKAPTHWQCDGAGKDDEAWQIPGRPLDDGQLQCRRCSSVPNCAECADDALVLLEHCCTRGGWQLNHLGTMNYHCSMTSMIAEGEAGTAPLAITLCALRAAGIPEPEITAAMEEK